VDGLGGVEYQFMGVTPEGQPPKWTLYGKEWWSTGSRTYTGIKTGISKRSWNPFRHMGEDGSCWVMEAVCWPKGPKTMAEVFYWSLGV